MLRRLTIGTALFGAACALILVGYTLFIALDGSPVESFRNASPAMQPTPLYGDYFTLSRRSIAAPRHGQVVAHRWPEDRTKQFVKRIVAVPGDTVGMIRGTLVLNGKPVDEPYAWHEERRHWGFLPKADILGEVWRIYYSRDSTGHIRWSRFGKRVR